MKTEICADTTRNKKHLKLMEAYLNNVEISNRNLGDKYTRFEDSKLDESRTLLFEIDKPSIFIPQEGLNDMELDSIWMKY